MKPYLIILSIFFTLIFSFHANGQRLRIDERISPRLRSVLTKEKQEAIEVIVKVDNLQELAKNKNLQILGAYPASNTAKIRVHIKQLNALIDSNYILFADIYRKPKEELTTGTNDQSLNNITYAHSRYPEINGDSILVSINEQRFDASDIDIKNRYIETHTGAETEFSHASIMATILAGGGNSSLYAKGAAWGAYLSSSDFSTLLPDPDSVYRQYGISIQNHSYGTGIESYYGADAAAYDESVWNNPTLVHVFSSGNSGTSTDTSGIYRNISGLANLTGSFKMAKNILTIGATDSINNVAALSSKGPAYDGRVKPELVAFGEDGSSGASAMVSGVAALLQQAYRNKFGKLPSAALVKAVLINSADDINNDHVDFISGYGSVNAYQAIKTINEKNIVEGMVQRGGLSDLRLQVPAGVAQLKITLTWTDTSAAPGMEKALVNDLDAILQFPATGDTWRPWVLNTLADRNKLLQPATRQTDTLNNTEQITVDHPEPGTYVLQIDGAKVRTVTPQQFAVAYQMDTVNLFYWTYPSSNDPLQSGSINIIRWQSNINEQASIDFSADGSHWKTVADRVDLPDYFYKWNVPDTVTTGILRMHLSSGQAVVSDTFVVSRKEELNVGFDCVDSFLLYWNWQPVRQYRIYHLGSKYMEPVEDSPDTFKIFRNAADPSFYYGVAPLIDGKPGLRSFTINYTEQGAGCYISTFFALWQDNRPELTLQLGTLYQVAQVNFQKLTASGYQTIYTVSRPANGELAAVDDHPSRGENIYRVQVILSNGTIINSNTDSVFYFPDQPVIMYPVPAQQGQPINLVVKDQGVYRIKVVDAMGRIVYALDLNDVRNSIPPLRLSKGLYFVQVYSDKGSVFVQKIVVL